MSGSFHIAVFARAPVAGESKTRLIPLLGEEGAAAAQRKMCLRTLATACAAAPGNVSLWTAGDGGHPFFTACANRFAVDCHAQCAGDLGMRMADCLRRLLRRHDTVLLIGTDCPVLAPADLHCAANALQQGACLVFTPAGDGGYVLVGAQEHEDGIDAAFSQAFRMVDWGTPQVMEQTRSRLAGIGCVWSECPTLWDVDTPLDYVRARQAQLL
ncbi:MAG: TIGR04282 family arsenosugar biosynthesis glycosyltransferase [Pseudomonadota bacterium]